MKNTALIALLLASVAFPALATGRGGEGNNTNCNGRGNPNSPCVPSAGGGQGGAGGSATSSANASASSRASNRTTVTTRATGGRATSNATGGSATANGTQTVNVTTGSGGGQVRQAPDVAAPAIWSNNPCVVSASGGVSGLGWGVAIGAGIEDADCTRRANAQHLTAMGEREAAREVLCGSREVREAFARIGRPCAADQARVVSVSAAPARVEAPAPVNTSGLSDDACRTLRARGMVVGGCP